MKFQLTTACAWKLLPLTASVKAEEPAGTAVGETSATMGAGAREGPPPELPEHPVKSVRAARELERRQREARRQAGRGVCRVVIKMAWMFRGTLHAATAFRKWNWVVVTAKVTLRRARDNTAWSDGPNIQGGKIG